MTEVALLVMQKWVFGGEGWNGKGALEGGREVEWGGG